MRLELINYEDKKHKPDIKIYFDRAKPTVKKETLQLLTELRTLLHKDKNRNLLLKLRYYNQYEQDEAILTSFKEEKDFKIFFNEPELLTLIKLSINDYDLPNVKPIATVITESELIYTINFEYGFFDSLQKSTLNILEKIYNTSPASDKYKYINKNLWLKYANNYREIIDLNYNTQIANTLKSDYSPSVYSRDDSKNGILYEDVVSDEEHLLYSFLGILFSCKNINPIIKKCETCGKFFIVHKTDTLTCNRITADGYTCNKRAIKDSKSKYKIDFVHAMEKRIRDLYKSDLMINEREIFQNEYPLKRKELSGKEYLYWLADHYKTNDKKQEWKLKIDEYQKDNPDFEENFSEYYKNNT